MTPRPSSSRCFMGFACALACLGYSLDRQVYAQVRVEFGQVEQSPSWFESWAFHGHSESTIKTRWKMEIEAEINKLAHLQLSEDQKEKLRLAGTGDIARFMREVQKAREATKDKIPDQNNVQEIQDILAPIQIRVATGLFKDGSLLQRMIEQVLSPEQKERWAQQQRELTEKRMRALIRIVVARLDAKVPMIASQREKLCDVTWNKVQDITIPKQFELHVVSMALDTLSREQLEPFLDPVQIKTLVARGESASFEDQLAVLGIKLKGN